MTKKIKYEKLAELIQALNSVPTADENGREIKDKLSYCVLKLAKRLSAIQKSQAEKLNDFNIEFCSVDKDGVILTDEKGAYRFTKEGLKNKNKAVKKFYENEDFEIEIYICKDSSRVESLGAWVKETLNGILFEVDIEEPLEIAD